MRDAWCRCAALPRARVMPRGRARSPAAVRASPRDLHAPYAGSNVLASAVPMRARSCVVAAPVSSGSMCCSRSARCKRDGTAEHRRLGTGRKQRRAAFIGAATCSRHRYQKIGGIPCCRDARGGRRANGLLPGTVAAASTSSTSKAKVRVAELRRNVAAPRARARRICARRFRRSRCGARPVRVCVLHAGDEPAQLLLERHRHGHARTCAEEHGREVLDLRAGERADDVLRDEAVASAPKSSKSPRPANSTNSASSRLRATGITKTCPVAPQTCAAG